MNEGKIFESAFRENIPKSAFYLRIRDPAQSFANTARFSLQNPFDCLIFNSPYLYCLELKSIKTPSLSFWREGDESKTTPNIKKNQIEGLRDAANHENVIAGLLINFRSSAQTYFIHISDFLKFTESTTKKSINQTDVLSIRHVVIEQTLKRTRYSYNIEKFLADCVECYIKEL